jgi:hypothetical protein
MTSRERLPARSERHSTLFVALVGFLLAARPALAQLDVVPSDPNACAVRTAEVGSAPLPADGRSLLREVLDGGKQTGRLQTYQSASEEDPVPIFRRAKERIDAFFGELASRRLDCKRKDIEWLASGFDQLRAEFEALDQVYSTSGPNAELPQLYKTLGTPAATLCESFAENPVQRDSFIMNAYAAFGKSAELAIDTAKKASLRRECAGRLIDALTARGNQAEGKLSDLITQGEISSSLKWIISLFVGSVCVIVLLISFFKESIQSEWVASGQVIQFSTATLLLIVIFALALSGKLSSETTATLLGAVGGYVLSQGVGKNSPKDRAPK